MSLIGFACTAAAEAIALACVFCDDIEFRRQFRRRIDLSPGAYRKQILSVPA